MYFDIFFRDKKGQGPEERKKEREKDKHPHTENALQDGQGGVLAGRMQA